MPKSTVVELEDLRDRLREAEETLAAIRNGEVDSLIVTGPHGDQVFSLKGAEQPYRVFVEQMLEGAVTLSSTGTILYCNSRFSSMMHSRLEKVIGAQIQSFVRPADQDQFQQILAAPDGRKLRLLLAATDGAFIPAQLSFSQMPVDDVEAICLVVTDMTEHDEKRELAAAMEKLRAYQEQLQKQNEELIRARAAAETASDAKDNFLAALSHELRTPLTPVLMTVSSLESNPTLSADARNEISIVRRNVELEARLIDDLLDVTRIVRGKIDLKLAPVDVHTVLAHALETCRSDMLAKKLFLLTDFHASQTFIEGDAVRVEQIFWNIIRNAVKFTPHGGKIIVRTHNDAAEIKVSISDTGIGIEPSAIGRIFTPFEQTDRAITQQFGGLGLGLTISRKLVELHGGELTAFSEGRNHGATFTLILPIIGAPKPTAQKPESPQQADNGLKLRILLVEDHEDTRASLARLLARRHVVKDVQDIASALNAAKEEGFDLVISDLGLPDGTGYQLMEQLRRQYKLKGICLSGFGMEEDIARASEAGFDHHLTKPIDFQKLESVIELLAK
jgi:PAS domain S-box-containing protein